ncbi:MAG TPA: hypothetical protein VFO60_07130 [Candidatus Dormibacteraeota bacterium]|nr:hypothetical protein [Candidatus Dormibacteraeota bacterium]
MDLQEWLVEELDDAVARLRGQVLELVPAERRSERPGGGNSIAWACFHAARHADLAQSAITGATPVLEGWRDQLPGAVKAGGGIEEAQQPWSDELDPVRVDGYLLAVCGAGQRLVSELEPDELELVPDATAALARGGVDAGAFDWLYKMWSGKPAAFLVRWPVIGHVANHTGEMIATRNRMGLSPF